ncbi:MAG TPA: aminotransferase class I/II-fold pyridoxal phosphate-dependent enzyme [Candidatus Limnocylindria bacterium]|nr:aminotransferase class I/II-fold pyridoxal phosphate-dependent enzyme [Candidatus Limnocylindria bacterium]
MSGDPLRLLRHAGPIEPYPLEPSDAEIAAEAGVPVGSIVRYDMNTLGGGPLPGVVEAWRGWDPAEAVQYGDLGYRRLRAAIGDATGVPQQRIIPGAGADELIRLVTMNVVGPGDAVVVPTPTFPMFAIEAGLAGARVIAVPREHPGRRQTVAELRDAASGARLVWACSPNNPTGDVMPVDEVRDLATGLDAIVVVDQVYLEFAEAAGVTDVDATPLLEERHNVLVLRSLSKAYGLAGARLGYLLVPDGLAQRFDGLRLASSVGVAAEVLALGALRDPATSRARHTEIMVERARLADALETLECEVLPGVANFVTFRPPDAPALARALLERGLVVRLYESGAMSGWLRATALAADENARLIEALTVLLG